MTTAVFASPSLRGRGLKSVKQRKDMSVEQSPSLRGRGLKYAQLLGFCFLRYVALFTRAWIEISDKSEIKIGDKGRPLYEGVD